MCALSDVVALAHAKPSSTTATTTVASPSSHTLPPDTSTAHPLNFWWVIVAVLVAFLLGRLVQFITDQRRGMGPKQGGGGKH